MVERDSMIIASLIASLVLQGPVKISTFKKTISTEYFGSRCYKNVN